MAAINCSGGDSADLNDGDATDAAGDAARSDADEAAHKVTELRLRRSSVHREHDMKRLQDCKEDLNDALLDFFVKLGQAVIPCGGLEGGFPSVAYLGSFFFDVLQKGGVKSGSDGHANVANWAKRRLGQGGLFFDGIGALAVPVNEMLVAGSIKEKHWWLALLVNPRGGSKPKSEEGVGLLCLDSLARAEVRCDPPVRAYRYGSLAYPVEVFSMYRQSFSATLRFRARGDGSSGALPDPRNSRLVVGGREFGSPYVELTVDRRGGYGVPGQLEGTLEFSLESTTATSGEYTLHFGDLETYTPPPRLTVRREATPYQRRVAQFLGGYVSKEWTTVNAGTSGSTVAFESSRVEEGLRLPDVPQQETANDCGYFMLEQTLLALQLTPEGFRTLASAPADMLPTLPWPSQKDILRRKTKLRDALETLFVAADEEGTTDVDALLNADAELRGRVQAALWDGPRFTEAVRTLASLSAPRREYTLAELEAMPTKTLRSLCLQRGVLQSGMIERSDFFNALAPLAVQPKPAAPPPPPKPPTEEVAATKRARDDEALPQAKKHLGAMKFTAADLESMPLKTLRDLCKQHGVLPACALERADFVQALIPLVSSSKAGPSPPTQPTKPAQPEPSKPEPAKPEPAVEVAAPEESAVDRKARWARSAGGHLSGVNFTMADLEVMPVKTLRALCVQHSALPPCAVERADFVQALAPLAVAKVAAVAQPPQPKGGDAAAPQQAAKAPAPAAPRRDFSKFLGSMKPNFTKADLEEMPVSTLRTLCIKYGKLPPGEVERSDLIQALRALAIKPAAGKDALCVDDMLDDDD